MLLATRPDAVEASRWVKSGTSMSALVTRRQSLWMTEIPTSGWMGWGARGRDHALEQAQLYLTPSHGRSV